MYLTDRRRETSRNYIYISPVAQNDRSTLSNSTEGSLVKIAQLKDSSWQATSRSPWSESAKSREGEATREGQYWGRRPSPGTGQPRLCRQYQTQLQTGYDF